MRGRSWCLTPSTVGGRSQCPEPEVRANAQPALRELRVQRDTGLIEVASVALIRKFASPQAENSGELPNRDTSGVCAALPAFRLAPDAEFAFPWCIRIGA